MTVTSTSADERLMVRVASGDRAAFTVLYNRFADAVMRQVCRTMGHASEAEDVCQDVFWKVWMQARRYDPTRSSPLTWIMLLTRYAAMDRLRSQGSRPRKTGSVDDDPDDWRFVAPETGDSLEHQEELSGAREALEGLPDRQKNALSLACLRGMTRWQIAGLEKLPVGTVKTLIRRGSMRMRGVLGEVA